MAIQSSICECVSWVFILDFIIGFSRSDHVMLHHFTFRVLPVYSYGEFEITLS